MEVGDESRRKGSGGGGGGGEVGGEEMGVSGANNDLWQEQGSSSDEAHDSCPRRTLSSTSVMFITKLTS